MALRLRIYLAWLAACLFAWCAFGELPPLPQEPLRANPRNGVPATRSATLAIEPPPLPTAPPPTVRRGRTVTLAWDASETPGCSYTLYWGSTEAFSNVVELGTNLTATVSGLPMFCDLMFCVSASANGLESDPSNEVSVRRYAPKTNIVVRITGEHMQTGPTVRGPWTPFGSTTILLTNPSATLFWRGAKLERWLQ